jgi:hypothetical protein
MSRLSLGLSYTDTVICDNPMREVALQSGKLIGRKTPMVFSERTIADALTRIENA